MRLLSLTRRRVLGGAGAAAALLPSQRSRAAPVPIRFATGGGLGSSEIETVIYSAAMPAAALPRLGQDYGLDMTFTSRYAAGRSAPRGGAGGHGDTVVQRTRPPGWRRTHSPTGLTVVSDNYQDGHAGHASNGFYVLDESPIKTMADLRGKIVAVNAFGSAVDLIARVALKRQGIDPRRDLQMVEIGLPNIGAAIRQKRVDWRRAGAAVPGGRNGDRRHAAPVQRCGCARPQCGGLQRRHQRLPEGTSGRRTRYAGRHVGALKYLSAPSNHDTSVSVTAALTKLPPSALGYVMTERDYYRAADGSIDAALIQRPIDALVELGLPARCRTGGEIRRHALPARMTRRTIDPPELFQRVVAGHKLYAYVQAVQGGELLFISGLLSRNAAGDIIGAGDMAAQISQIGENLALCLTAAGATLADLVKTTTFTTDIDEFFRHADVRMRYFGARSSG